MLGRGKKYRERRGVKMGFIRVLEERRKMFFNIQAQCAIPKWIQYFHVLLCRLNKIWTKSNIKSIFKMNKYIGGSAERKSDIIGKRWESYLLWYYLLRVIFKLLQTIDYGKIWKHQLPNKLVSQENTVSKTRIITRCLHPVEAINFKADFFSTK